MKREHMAAIVVGVVGVVLFTVLLTTKYISQTLYGTLLITLALFAMAIAMYSRILELDLKNMKITLAQIQEAKREVFAKEADLNNIALALVRIIAFSNAVQGRYGSNESHALQREWYSLQTVRLLDRLGVPENERQELLKYDRLYHQIDAQADQDEKVRLVNAIFEMMRTDLGRERTNTTPAPLS